MKHIFDINNKTILITGANGYLGMNLINFFAKYKKIFIFATDKEISKLNIKKINKINLNKKIFIKFIKCDLSNLESRNNLLKKISSKKIDVIINNATYISASKSYNSIFNNQTSDNWKDVFEVNLSSVFHLIKSLIPNLKKTKNPSIINISSIYGFIAPEWNLYKRTTFGNPAAYAASKAGLIQLTKWFASTLGPKIRVNSISIGGIFRGQPKIFVKKYSDKTILKRMATEKDLNGAVMFLSSAASSYITGTNLIIDGGITAKI